ncbi:MAG: hypothetical protein IKO03_13005 [Lachnospiraceae bacterium]|nr:hypothetical protein [Lachnospiraceae bacterium]
MKEQRVGQECYKMKRLKVDKKWIREHLPKEVSDRTIDRVTSFPDYYRDGLKIFCNGDRAIFYEEYEAKDEEDLLLWAYKECCQEISYAVEANTREENTPKWRYSMDHMEDDDWMYVERENYVYNTIEDTRLVNFEEYLRLVKNGLPKKLWEEEVEEYVKLMNQGFKVKHWDYDMEKTCFIEISDSKPYFSKKYKDVGEPTPKQIIKA